MSTLGAVVVGCGAVGSDYDSSGEAGPPLSHAGAYVAEPWTALLAGVDPDPAARQRFSTRWGVPAYATADEALDRHRPALVSLAGPPQTRLAGVRTALSHGVVGIWAEKPLAEDADTAAQIVDACHGVALQVNFLRRFDALHQSTVARLRGQLTHADFRYSGTLRNYGSHALDLFAWAAGPVREVQVHADGLDWADAGGATATFRRVMVEGVDVFDCTFYTRRSRLMLTAMGEELCSADPTTSALFPEHRRLAAGELTASDGIAGAMAAGAASLVSAAVSGVPPACTGEDGLLALRTIETIEALRSTG